MRARLAVFALLAAGCASSPQRLAERGVGALGGAAATHPEGTLAAVAEAVRLGAHLIALDVRVTRDGRLVVLRDATVDRTTDGSGAVAELSFFELNRLDAGSWKDARFAGERIPSLLEVLRALPRDVWLDLELHAAPPLTDEELARRVARLVVDEGRTEQVVLTVPRPAAVAAHDVDPRVRVGRPLGSERWDTRPYPTLARFADPVDAAELAATRAGGTRPTHVGADAGRVAELLRRGVDFPVVPDVAAALDAAGRAGVSRR